MEGSLRVKNQLYLSSRFDQLVTDWQWGKFTISLCLPVTAFCQLQCVETGLCALSSAVQFPQILLWLWNWSTWRDIIGNELRGLAVVTILDLRFQFASERDFIVTLQWYQFECFCAKNWARNTNDKAKHLHFIIFLSMLSVGLMLGFDFLIIGNFLWILKCVYFTMTSVSFIGTVKGWTQKL